MIRTGLLRAAARPSHLLTRPFSTLQPLQSALIPGLGDLPADSAAQFETKLKAYREKQSAELARKDAEAAASAKAAKEAAKKSPLTSTSSPAKPKISGGVVARLLHGSEEAQEDTRQLEQSYTQVLARGKYVHEIVFHRVKPEKTEEYVKLISEEYPRRATDVAGEVKLVGSWMTEVGEMGTFVHIWEYNGYTGYHNTLRHFNEQKITSKFQAALRPLLASRSNSLMQEFSFWPTTPPRELGGIFELRSYILHPGKLLEWESFWRVGLAARRSQGMEGVGAWFAQVGGLNEVHYMWQFGDLQSRAEKRSKSWNAVGWADTVHKTVPLIADMQSRILVPMKWSPVR